MRGRTKRERKPVSIRKRMNRLVATFAAMIFAVFVVVVSILAVYQSQYTGLLTNVTTASEFNLDFKESIDLKMYYYVIESQYSEGLPIDEVEAAQALAQDLISTTTEKDSLRAIISVLDLCQNLEEKIYLIQETESYDERQLQLENNVYVLTSLIQEYMYNYLYYESVHLNEQLANRTRRHRRILRGVLIGLAAVIVLTLALSFAGMVTYQSVPENLTTVDVVCTLDGEEYVYTITYDQNYRVVEAGGDAWLFDHVGMDEYSDANRQIALIEDYFALRGGAVTVTEQEAASSASEE